MDAELKTYLEGMEARLREQIGEVRNYAVDLREQIAGVRRNATDMDARLRKEIAEARRHTTDTETHLLGEFWKWARQADLRYRQYYGHVTGVDQRVGVVEERITTVEDRMSELERRNGPAGTQQ